MEGQFLLFEHYLAGELSKEELVKFENLLQTDIDFKKAFNQYREVHNSLELTFKNNNEQLNFENNLKNISNTYFEKSTSKSNYKWYYSIAASIAVLLSVYLFYPSTKPSYEEYITYPSVNFTVRGNQENILLDAQNAFNNKNFTKANELFSEVLKKETENTEIKLYNGLALIEINKFNEASTLLNSIANGNSSFKYQAIWYLALSNLKQNKYAECKLLLEKLPEEFNQYLKAKKLLKNLPE